MGLWCCTPTELLSLSFTSPMGTFPYSVFWCPTFQKYSKDLPAITPGVSWYPIETVITVLWWNRCTDLTCLLWFELLSLSFIVSFAGQYSKWCFFAPQAKQISRLPYKYYGLSQQSFGVCFFMKPYYLISSLYNYWDMFDCWSLASSHHVQVVVFWIYYCSCSPK